MKKHDEQLGYLTATIEDLHDDIKEIREDVRILKEDFTRRGVIYKAGAWIGSILALSIGGIINFLLNRN